MQVQQKKSAISDCEKMKLWLSETPDTERVTRFVPGPGIQKLDLCFDIDALREALDSLIQKTSFEGGYQDKGFGAISLTRRPGIDSDSENDLSGRYWLRPHSQSNEVSYEDVVDEFAFSEFIPAYRNSYFETVHKQLSQLFPIGRMRVLSKGLYNCNSWHRDPEPRLHIPVVTNPGSLFVVNNHCTHLPADGSVYFTDTRGYHTALNGGLYDRVHIVAALPIKGKLNE